jgi:dUTP pyrophosphatase
MKNVSVRIARTPDAADLPLPGYMTAGAAGMDLYANVHDELTLLPGEWFAVPNGVIIALPESYEGQVRSRSGLAYKHGVVVLQGIGTIDWDYRGELKTLLANRGREPHTIRRGDRIAQLVIHKVERAVWDIADSIEPDEPARGTGGYGSTGGVSQL